MTRPLTVIEIIRTLLRSLLEVRETLQLNEGSGDGGNDDRLLLMPGAYHQGSYAALEVALRRMHNQGHQQSYGGESLHTLWWHLSQRYLMVERRRRQVPVKLPGRHGKHATVMQTRMVEVLPAEYRRIPEKRREQCEQLGVEWLAAEFERRGVVPQLPIAIWEALAA